MSDERPSDPELSREALLGSLPLHEPDWDALSQRIEARLATAPASEQALFEPPLPAAGEDGTLAVPLTADDAISESVPPGDETPAPPIAVAGETAEAESRPELFPEARPPSDSRREGGSLAALARASMARRGSADTASLAKESLAVASQSRAQGDQVAQRVHALASAPTSSAVPAASTSMKTVPPSRRSDANARGPWIGAGIAAIGLAAGFGLFLAGQRGGPDPLVTASAPETAKPETTREAPVTASATPRAEPAPALAERTPEPTSADGRPSVASLPPPLARAEAAKPAGSPGRTQPLSSASGQVAAEKVVLDEERPAQPKGAATPASARSSETGLRPADDSSARMTDRPSAGAAQAAVGAVLGAARSCVAGHPSPSSAELIFGSDGLVRSVSVAGPAAGTGAAGCIEAALKKARVQPFAATSFSLGVTVRPP